MKQKMKKQKQKQKKVKRLLITMMNNVKLYALFKIDRVIGI